MTDLESICKMLESIGIVRLDEDYLPYATDNVFCVRRCDVEELNDERTVLDVRGEGYEGFFSRLEFDADGRLVAWSCWE